MTSIIRFDRQSKSAGRRDAGPADTWREAIRKKTPDCFVAVSS
jgi:hypothetical protein